MSNRRSGLRHPSQFGILAVDGVRKNCAGSEERLATDFGAWQELAVVRIEVRLNLVTLERRRHFAGARPVVLVEVTSLECFYIAPPRIGPLRSAFHAE